MISWFDRHRRARDQLSVYIDGGLAAAAVERLERHLAECERCRAELLQLRDTVSALRELPEVEPPRSFALHPEQVRGPQHRPSAPSPLAFGVRLAAAGVAVALAAVMIVDLGGLDGGEQATERAGAPQTAAEETGAEEGAAPADLSGAAAKQTPTPGAVEEEGDSGDAGAAFTGQRDAAGETPAAGPEGAPAADAAEPAVSRDEGGIGALTAAEIGLAAALALLVGGGVALAVAGRRR